MKIQSLSIIIVSFNTKDLLLDLLGSLKKSIKFAKKSGYFIETIVIDNNSTDSTVAELKKNFKWIKLIANSRNIGFSAASNKGILKAKGEVILLLNSDTKVSENTLVECLDYLNTEQKVGALTCRLELPNGRIDPASHRGFPTPWNSFCYFTGLEKLFARSRLFAGYHQGWKDLKEVHQIDSCSGAFMMVRQTVINKIGLLDDRFFMYGEDLDWCYRIKESGFQVIYFPQTKVIHYKGQSGRKKLPDNRIQHDLVKKIKKESKQNFYQTMKLFYQKHYIKKYPKIIYSLVLSGIWLVSKIRK